MTEGSNLGVETQGSSQDTKSRYINPKTDFAFKRFFGKEVHKDLLISFLNGIFKKRKVIVNLEYNDVNYPGRSVKERRNVFDVHCTGSDGEKFIVEMQQGKHTFFKERMIYYVSNLIYQQGTSVAADWNYELPEVYLVAIMDFCFDELDPQHYEHDIRLIDVNTHKEFYSKLGYIFIELPKFKKKDTELETKEDGWLFSLCNMNNLEEIPLPLSNQEEFVKLFNLAEVSNLDPEEMKAYEASLKIARDNNSLMESMKLEGRIEGRIEGKIEGKLEGQIEIAKKLKAKGYSVSDLAELTGLSIEQVETL